MQTNPTPSAPTTGQPSSVGHGRPPDEDNHSSPFNQPRWLVPLYVLIVLAHILAVAPVALLTILLDGLTALIVVVIPPILAGLWFVPLFRLNHWPLRWQFLIAASLGLGCMSLLILMLGLIGALHRPLWFTVLVLLTVVGIVRLHAIVNAARNTTHTSAPRRKRQSSWLWLLTAPYLSASLLAASNPPGLIWSEEGYGYDVLEYHLQMPKEYVQNGRIAYAPHNVYASFPFNVEMLYLAGMIHCGDAIAAGTVANFIHLIFAILLIYAAWMAGSLISPTVALVSAVALGTVGWLPYLSGLAYVENAMFFFGMAALAFWLRAMLQPTPNITGTSANEKKDSIITLASLAGLTAGFACGCKYTAVPLIAMPIALAWLMTGSAWAARLKAIMVFTAACLLTLSPWLLKNIAHTGNPVFPLAHSLFQTYPPGWGPQEAERWQRAHSWSGQASTPQHDEHTHTHDATSWWKDVKQRLAHLWHYLPGDHYQRFGPAIFLLGLVGWWTSRHTRIGMALLFLILLPLAIWMFATHLYARFAVVFLLPLALLVGLTVNRELPIWRMRVVNIILALGALWNLAFVLKLQAAESVPQVPASLIAEGQLPGFEYIGLINRELDPAARLLLIGEARPYYLQRRTDYFTVFNRNPFIEAVETALTPQDAIKWLQEQQYTHVLVNWAEVRRLRSTYGFTETITTELFESWERAGLIPVHAWEHPAIEGPYVNLYAVPK